MPELTKDGIGIEPIKIEPVYEKQIAINEGGRTLTVTKTPTEPIPETTTYDFDSYLNVMDQQVDAILSWYTKITADIIQPILDIQDLYSEQNGDINQDVRTEMLEKLSKLNTFNEFVAGL